MWKLQVIASIPFSKVEWKEYHETTFNLICLEKLVKSLEIPSLLQIMVVGKCLTLVCFVCGMCMSLKLD